MEHQEQLEKETEEAINAINKKTGRNMPQAIATGAVLVILILACLLISIDLFVYLVVLFMVLALWELRVDFATAGLHIPVAVLWVCSAATLLSTYYSERHIVAMTVCVLVSLVVVAIAASAKVTFAAASLWPWRISFPHRCRRKIESSFNHEQGEVSHSRLSHVAVSMFTVLYIPLLASCLIMPLTFNDHPVAHAIMMVFMPALSDTGGLFAGAWLGKHKLSPAFRRRIVGGSCRFHSVLHDRIFCRDVLHVRVGCVDFPLVGPCRGRFHDRHRRNVWRFVRIHVEARYRHQGHGTPA